MIRRRKNKHASKTRRSMAVTLTEVISSVVVSALLSGIVVAALGRLRGASQNDVCLNNLRRIAAASADYSADDPDDNAIPVHRRYLAMGNTVVSDYQYGGKSGNVDYAGDFIYTIEGNFGTYTRPLNPQLYDVNVLVAPECRDPGNLTQACIDADKALDLPVFRCPADTGKTGLHYTRWGQSGRTAYDYFGTSYNANVNMICSGYNGDMRSNAPFLRSRADVPDPARTILYIETNGRFAWAWGYGPWAFGTTFTVHGWHGEDWRFNAAFVDGHAQTITMRGSADGGEVNGPADAEYVPGLPGGMSEYWQIITRGPDWQLDTLPRLPIDTNKRCGGGAGVDATDDARPSHIGAALAR